MTIQQLRYVTAVAETGNISEAAKRMFISQPSMTKAIRELEEELDLIIFHRSNKGVTLSNEGDEFLGYARQVLQQMELLEAKYKDGEGRRILFSVSSQHYSFAINAFVDIIKAFGEEQYDFTLRETQTYEIIRDVSTLKSEVGVLYTCSKNEDIILRMLKRHELKFEEVFVAKPHVFMNATHPLAGREAVTLADMAPYPYLSFEQGENNSFYFSEEILSDIPRPKNIKVRDRATLFNLLIGLDGYTVSTGVISKELNGADIISKPLIVDEYIRIGVVTKRQVALSRFAQAYIETLKRHLR